MAYTCLAYIIFVLMHQKLIWVQDLGASRLFFRWSQKAQGGSGEERQGGKEANIQCVNEWFTTLDNWGSSQPGPLKDSVRNTPQNLPQGAWKLKYWSVNSHLSLVESLSWDPNSLVFPWPEHVPRTIWERYAGNLGVRVGGSGLWVHRKCLLQSWSDHQK